MRSAKNILIGTLIRGGIGFLAYSALWLNSEGAENVLKFLVVVTFLLNFACAVSKDVRIEMSKTGPPFPTWANAIFGVGLSINFAFCGWFGYATMSILLPIFSAVIYGTKTKEA